MPGDDDDDTNLGVTMCSSYFYGVDELIQDRCNGDGYHDVNKYSYSFLSRFKK